MSVETKAKKSKIIESLSDSFKKANIAILTDYRGLKTADLTTLRRRLQKSNSDFHVVKNTLARFAADKAGNAPMAKAFEGPMAVALGFGEEAETAKTLTTYIREAKSTLTIKKGFLRQRAITPDEVTNLANLPPRNVLVGQAIGQIKAPIYNLVGVLSSPMRGIMGVLQARMKQLEGA